MAELLRPTGYVRQWKQLLSELGWWHSFELPDGSLIRGVHSVDGLGARLAPFSIAEDLSGKRVLDIGSWDGWYAFEMERRGAEVLAIDIWDNPRFHQMRSILGSKVGRFRMVAKEPAHYSVPICSCFEQGGGRIRPFKPTPRKALGVATKARKAGNRGGVMIGLCGKTGGANAQRVEWNP